MGKTTRYFQHLNPRDPKFQKVTELDYIDDTDPNFVLYYFKDGDKCNKDYIGALNEKNVYGKKEYTEVSHPNNAWQFDISDIKREVKYAINAEGQRVEIADILDRQDTPVKEGKRIVVKKEPEFALPEDDTDDNEETFNFNTAITAANDNSTHLDSKRISEDNTHISMDSIIDFNDKDGNPISVSVKDLIEKYNKEPEVKIVEKTVEKIVEKEVPIKKDTIEILLDYTQKSLIENMIDMSQKDTCDIDMEITLSLPPVSVYNIIKTVYPAGMAKSFVDIIANRMDIKELKTSVANGLLTYYDNDSEVVIEGQDSSK